MGCVLFVFGLGAGVRPCLLHARQVAITIDDLPFADKASCDFEETRSVTRRLMEPVQAQKVPVAGFVIGERCGNLTEEQRRDLLRVWLDAGAELGNHTWSHPDLNDTPLPKYEEEILRTDAELRGPLGVARVRYFRAPYLHDGATSAVKDWLHAFLAEHGYREAPVTIDDSDWMFASVYGRALDTHDAALARRVREAYIPYMQSVVEFFERRSVEVLGRECPQVLLIHASRLNAEMLPALLQMFRDRGYEFVSLESAMSDSAYRLRDGYVGRKGLSWIHRWGIGKGQAVQLEPDEPRWISDMVKAQR
nr:polysaccharide deacetylase family protein [Granulicella sp. dw_53]